VDDGVRQAACARAGEGPGFTTTVMARRLLESGREVVCEGNLIRPARMRDHGTQSTNYEGEQVLVARISSPSCNTWPLLGRT
jgi:hypothetical protein